MRLEVVFTLHEIQQEPLINFASMRDQGLYFDVENSDKYARKYHQAREMFDIIESNIHFYVRDSNTAWKRCSLFIQYWSHNEEIEFGLWEKEEGESFSKIIEPECPVEEYVLTDEVVEEIRSCFKNKKEGSELRDKDINTKMEIVTQKFEKIANLHDKLENFQEARRYLGKQSYPQTERIELTIIVDGEGIKSLVLDDDNKDFVREVINQNIDKLEKQFNEECRKIMR